jgi:hypothetical protein
LLIYLASIDPGGFPMDCTNCSQQNDADALFCEHCGSPLTAGRAETAPPVSRRPYLYWAALALALVIVLAAGYYKFILPKGVAAEVNGEVITLAEVDQLMRGATGGQAVPEAMAGRMRSRIISDLIAERVAWQEARKAGTTVAKEDVDAAWAQAAGGDRKAFEARVKEQYGSVKAFREALERRIGIRKHIAAKVTAGIADPAAADARVGAWLQEATARSTIRVSLADPPSGSGGCGCCNTGGAGPGVTSGQASPQARQAEQAALAYWRRQNGDEKVTTRLTDFGCHIQVDIVKGNRIARSLRYQDGAISEL